MKKYLFLALVILCAPFLARALTPPPSCKDLRLRQERDIKQKAVLEQQLKQINQTIDGRAQSIAGACRVPDAKCIAENGVFEAADYGIKKCCTGLVEQQFTGCDNLPADQQENCSGSLGFKCVKPNSKCVGENGALRLDSSQACCPGLVPSETETVCESLMPNGQGGGCWKTCVKAKSTDCAKEGGKWIYDNSSAPGSPNNRSVSCCTGLLRAGGSTVYDSSCRVVGAIMGGDSGVCTKCGNGICETGEHKCTCPADCKTKECVKEGGYITPGQGSCCAGLVENVGNIEGAPPVYPDGTEGPWQNTTVHYCATPERATYHCQQGQCVPGWPTSPSGITYAGITACKAKCGNNATTSSTLTPAQKQAIIAQITVLNNRIKSLSEIKSRYQNMVQSVYIQTLIQRLDEDIAKSQAEIQKLQQRLDSSSAVSWASSFVASAQNVYQLFIDSIISSLVH